MQALPGDWSEEVLRTSTNYNINFSEVTRPIGTIATAIPNKGFGAPERHLSVDEIALLAALQFPRTLPRHVSQQIRDCGLVVSRLVLDGLVEVRCGRRFVSGAEALKRADKEKTECNVEEASRISELALWYALALRHLKPAALEERLYAFNSHPRNAQSPDSIKLFAAHTGIDVGDPSPRLGGWTWTIQRKSTWLYFRRGASGGGPFKIYLCPQPKHVSKVIPGFAAVLGHGHSGVFKVAFPMESLARADKIVAYLPTFEALQEAVTKLAALQLDVAVQAVPFSASVPSVPLLSWGVDPPNFSGRKSSSWRSWLTGQIAECVQSIPTALTPRETLDHLKAALQLRDVDPVNWLPLQQLLAHKWRIQL
jgi:hypothetical protein